MAAVAAAVSLLLCSRAALVAAGALRGNATDAAPAQPLLGNASGALEELMAAAAEVAAFAGASWGGAATGAQGVPEQLQAEPLLGNASAGLEEVEAAAAELAGNVSALAQRGSRHGHGSSRRRPGGAGHGGVMTLYHTTSPAVAELIMKSGFKPGRGGWCGGAIYFIDTPTLPKTKYSIHTLDGAVIEAKVDMGRMAEMDRHCDASFGHGLPSARRHGYDSIRFDPGDGDEFVIHSARRVLSVRRYK